MFHYIDFNEENSFLGEIGHALNYTLNMFKYFLTPYILISSNISLANTAPKSTVYSKCSRSAVVENKNIFQTIIVATETLSESKCKSIGQKKAEQYLFLGWKCVGRNNQELFSCESDKASTYANYQGIKLDNLTYTNLQKHRGIVVYINPDSNKVCHEDQAELISAGVKDAVCHKRSP